MTNAPLRFFSNTEKETLLPIFSDCISFSDVFRGYKKGPEA